MAICGQLRYTQEHAFHALKRPILVVDDEPDVLYSLRELLRREFDVHTAGSGREALQILEQTPVHLIMTDQRMPEMTGVQFLRRAKSEHPEAIRLVYTGYADPQAIIDAINQGNVFRFVTKPWDADTLMTCLREAGEKYDLIVEREQVLTDLGEFEQRCVAFADGLRQGTLGSLTRQGEQEAVALHEMGKALKAQVARIVPQPPVAT